MWLQSVFEMPKAEKLVGKHISWSRQAVLVESNSITEETGSGYRMMMKKSRTETIFIEQ